jgi:hypothetical protein
MSTTPAISEPRPGYGGRALPLVAQIAELRIMSRKQSVRISPAKLAPVIVVRGGLAQPCPLAADVAAGPLSAWLVHVGQMLLPASSEGRPLSGFCCHVGFLPEGERGCDALDEHTGSSASLIDVSDATTDARMCLASKAGNRGQSGLPTYLPTRT